MQSIIVYGRVLTRAVFNSFQNYSSLDGYSHGERSYGTEVNSRHQSSSQLRSYSLNEPLHFISASCGFPKDFTRAFTRKDQFGDDACFMVKHQNADVIGVADGVGGWRMYDVDPSLFSSSLMSKCEHLVNTGQFNPKAPVDIIADSYYGLIEEKVEIVGSSTACIVCLDKFDQTVHTANIGDSGFLIIRNGKILHRSEEQTHYFNTPHQLSQPPRSQIGTVLRDSPESADTSTFDVQKGDLVLVATDGLFDNVPEQMIVNELSNIKDHKKENIQDAVNSLALQARVLAFDSNYESPFCKRARELGIEASGGKPDDITIVLASVNT